MHWGKAHLSATLKAWLLCWTDLGVGVGVWCSLLPNLDWWPCLQTKAKHCCMTCFSLSSSNHVTSFHGQRVGKKGNEKRQIEERDEGEFQFQSTIVWSTRTNSAVALKPHSYCFGSVICRVMQTHQCTNTNANDSDYCRRLYVEPTDNYKSALRVLTCQVNFKELTSTKARTNEFV